MTNKEALAAAISVPGITDTILEKSCIDNDITAADTYSKSNAKSIDLAAADVLSSVVLSSLQEGGFAFGISKDAIVSRIAGLRKRWGLSDTSQPQIKDGRAW